MKAAVYHGPGSITWDEVARPISPRRHGRDRARRRHDDLRHRPAHPQRRSARASPTAGSSATRRSARSRRSAAAVKNVKVGDRVLVSCVTACGACRYCRDGHSGQCLGGGGWILGNEIDGTQAEYVRVPFADNSTYPVPAGVSDEAVLMLSDILPTAYEVGVLNGGVRPGDVVAVVGAGPIGLSAILGAKLFSPSNIVAIDMSAVRLDAAKQFGADLVFNNTDQDPIEFVRESDRRPRRRRGDRGGRSVGDLRARRRPGATGWARREHRRARCAGDAAPRADLGPGPHNHDRARRRVLDVDAASTRGQR